MHARLPNFHFSQAGQQLPPRQMAVANHLPPTTFVALLRVRLDPVRDFGLDGPGQHSLGAIPQNRRQDIAALRQWQHIHVCRRILHGGVLLCLVGSWVEIEQITPRVRRLFHLAINNFWL